MANNNDELRDFIRYRVQQEYEKYHDKSYTSEEFWIEQIVEKLSDTIHQHYQPIIQEARDSNKEFNRGWDGAYLQAWQDILQHVERGKRNMADDTIVVAIPVDKYESLKIKYQNSDREALKSKDTDNERN